MSQDPEPDVIRPMISCIEDEIQDDNYFAFEELVDIQLSQEKSRIADCKLDLAQVIRCIISHEAVECATALLRGETKLMKDANVATKGGYYPLHYAAQSLSPRMIKLFLELGASPDVLCIDRGGKDGGLTPLALAIKTTICNNKDVLDWSPPKCIFSLIFSLCLPELQKSLEAIQLLAYKSEVLQMASMTMASCGKLIELAILLMVAWEKLLNKGNGDQSTPLEHRIKEELKWTAGEEAKLFCRIGCNGVLNAHKRRCKLLLSASFMLHIFYQVGGVLDKFRLSERTEPIQRRDLAVEFVDLMGAAGFKLEIKGSHEDIRIMMEQPNESEMRKKKEEVKTPLIVRFPDVSPPIYCSDLFASFHTWSLPCANHNQSAPLPYCEPMPLRPRPLGSKFLNIKGWNWVASSLKRGARFL